MTVKSVVGFDTSAKRFTRLVKMTWQFIMGQSLMRCRTKRWARVML